MLPVSSVIGNSFGIVQRHATRGAAVHDVEGGLADIIQATQIHARKPTAILLLHPQVRHLGNHIDIRHSIKSIANAYYAFHLLTCCLIHLSAAFSISWHFH
jgi:hypothetical protein